MLSLETIPDDKREERDFAEFAIAVLSFCYHQKEMKFEDSDRVFSGEKADSSGYDADFEKDSISLVKKAIFFLYNKRGIRFYPPRPGATLGPDEVLLPAFMLISRRMFDLSHYLILLGEASWVLTAKEREMSQMINTFVRQSTTRAIGSGNSEVRPQGTVLFPKGMRKDF